MSSESVMILRYPGLVDWRRWVTRRTGSLTTGRTHWLLRACKLHVNLDFSNGIKSCTETLTGNFCPVQTSFQSVLVSWVHIYRIAFSLWYATSFYLVYQLHFLSARKSSAGTYIDQSIEECKTTYAGNFAGLQKILSCRGVDVLSNSVVYSHYMYDIWYIFSPTSSRLCSL